MEITKTNSIIVHPTVFWKRLFNLVEIDDSFKHIPNYKGVLRTTTGDQPIYVFTNQELDPTEYVERYNNST